MTQVAATFDVSEFELRNFTDPYLSPSQASKVQQTEDRVNGQLNFLAQMLGWSGPNYWDNLATTPDQKRQLLGGTFGVYNSYIIPRVYEIRNWDNKIVVDTLQFLQPGRQTQVATIVVANETYQIQSVEVEGDKYLISIGELSDTFLESIANDEIIQVDIPTYRPAPFYRPSVGISGDAVFRCGNDGSNLVLFPAYDSSGKFPYLSNILFKGSVYYFDQPVYFSTDSTSLAPDFLPSYNENLGLWYLALPESLNTNAGITGYLAWANSNSVQSNNYSLPVLVKEWSDPSDWNAQNVLNNFRGVWGNKGGALPFNFAFDALSIHGFNEQASVTLPVVERSIEFNSIVDYIYYQKTTISSLAPGGAALGDIWWNDANGALSVWIPDSNGCSSWVEVDYRNSPTQLPSAQVVYSNVAQFQASSPALPPGSIVRIDDTSGLSIADNVIGVKGTLTGGGAVVIHNTEDSYWVPSGFYYQTVTDFGVDAEYLPETIPVVIYNASGLVPDNGVYQVDNLKFNVTGDYEVVLQKAYTNTTWLLYPESLLKYIANSALFGGPLQGQMWWDYVNSDPNTRAAAIFYTSPHPASSISVDYPGEDLDDGVYNGVELLSLTGIGGGIQVDITVIGNTVTSVSLVAGQGGDKYSEGDLLIPDSNTYPGLVGAVFKVDSTVGQAWVAVNGNPLSGTPSPALDLGTIKFYCNGDLLQAGTDYITQDYTLSYLEDTVNGNYDFTYSPRTFEGQVQLPIITISDSLTSAYRADITHLVFSGLTYTMSPSVFNSESPLRLWKAQDLQVVDTVELLGEDNYINPLLADINNGPGPENWEKYFVRLPLEYERNGAIWQKVALICQNFAYWGSSIEPEKMDCPSEDQQPAIYEELFLYDQPVPDYTYVYCEPYLYSDIAYSELPEGGFYSNAGIYPASDVQFDSFYEAELIEYDPLHSRQADVTSPVNSGYGEWLGQYVNVSPCVPLTGFLTTDLVNNGVEPVSPPVWDASIYKFAPTCENEPESYTVDANHYKISYSYFIADASAAEDPFFDIQKEASWRYPVTQPKTLYMTPR